MKLNRFVFLLVAILVTAATLQAEPPSTLLAQPPGGIALDEKGRLRTRLMQVIAKDNGVWKIVAYHNTDVKQGIPITEL